MSRYPSHGARVCALAIVLALATLFPAAPLPLAAAPVAAPAQHLPAAGSHAQAGPVAPLLLQTGTVIPEPGAPGERSAAVEQAGGAPAYYIVQFTGPVQEAWKARVAALGGLVLDYIPEFAFVVYMDGGALQAVAGLDFVASVNRYRPEFKVTKDLRQAVESGQVAELVVQTFPNAAVDAVSADVRAQGAEVTEATANPVTGMLRVRLGAARLDGLAGIEAVRWIEPWRERKLYNNIARSSQALDAEWA